MRAHSDPLSLSLLPSLLPSLRNDLMVYQLGSSDWRDLFDVIVVGARKPMFYEEAG